MITYEPKINIVSGRKECLPDNWIRGSLKRPSDDFVVSRDLNGVALSTYADEEWDWTPYTSDGRPLTFNFASVFATRTKGLQDEILDEIKFLFFLLIWVRSGDPLSDGSLTHYFRLLRRVARLAGSHEMRVANLLSEPALLKGVFSRLPLEACKWLCALLGHLSSIGPKHLGYEVVGMGLLGKELKKIESYRSSIKQHPPIPTRIYDHLLRCLSNELDEFVEVKDKLLALAEDLVEAKRSRYSKDNLSGPAGNEPSILDEDFEKLLVERGLAKYFNSRNLIYDLRSVSKALSEIQRSCALTIVALSGMRWGECKLLEVDCAHVEQSDGMNCYVIEGFSTKFTGGRKTPARWVTSEEGYRAIELCSEVAKFIGRLAQTTTNDSTRIGALPLLVSTAYLDLAGKKKPKSTAGTLRPNQMAFAYFPMLKQRILLSIEESDLEELEFIDPFRAWREEKRFELGKLWQLTPHQLRRSLALYASRSGLVSMQSLRRQLQHLTEAMARYYARGSGFAKDFIGADPTHFGREFQNTQPISSALGYLKNVIYSADKLFGAHGVWIEKRLSRESDTGLLPDRAETISLFKRGQMAYIETPLGGCTSVARCDKRLMGSVTSCIGCDSLAGKRAKLVRVIQIHEKFVSHLPEESVERRTESAELDILRHTLSRLDNLKGTTLNERI